MRCLHTHQLAMVRFADSRRGRGLWLEVPGRAVVLDERFGHDYGGGPAVMLFLDPDWRAEDPTDGPARGRLILRPQGLTVAAGNNLLEGFWCYSYDPSWTSRLQDAIIDILRDYHEVDIETPAGAAMVAARALAPKLAARDDHVTLASAVVARDADASEAQEWLEERPGPDVLGVTRDELVAWQRQAQEWAAGRGSDPGRLSDLVSRAAGRLTSGHGHL